MASPLTPHRRRPPTTEIGLPETGIPDPRAFERDAVLDEFDRSPTGLGVVDPPNAGIPTSRTQPVGPPTRLPTPAPPPGAAPPPSGPPPLDRAGIQNAGRARGLSGQALTDFVNSVMGDPTRDPTPPPLGAVPRRPPTTAPRGGGGATAPPGGTTTPPPGGTPPPGAPGGSASGRQLDPVSGVPLDGQGFTGPAPGQNVNPAPLEGLVLDRALSGGDPNSLKDAFTRAVASVSFDPRGLSKEEIEAGIREFLAPALEAQGVPVLDVQGEKILFADGGGFVDVVRGAGSTDAAWQWLPPGSGGGEPSAGGGGGRGGIQIPTSIDDLAESDVLARILAALDEAQRGRMPLATDAVLQEFDRQQPF